MIPEIVQLAVLIVIVVAAIIAVRARDLIKSVIALAAFSLALSAEFFLLHAPDVAIAEAAVGAGITTAIYIFTIRSTRRDESEEEILEGSA